MDTSWVVQWAGWIWALLFGGVLVFELYTLWWNEHRGDGKQRANLTAYVKAVFGIGDRQLKRKWPPAIMVAFLVWLILHFTGVIG